MLSGLRRWWALPARERRLLPVLAALQPAVSLALRWFGYKRTRAWLERHSGKAALQPANEAALDAAQRLAELARIAGTRGPLGSTCLRQSLAVYWLLRRRGLRPELRLGVGQMEGAGPDMHAWVELAGQPLAQPGLRHAAFPATAASRQTDTAATTSGKRA